MHPVCKSDSMPSFAEMRQRLGRRSIAVAAASTLAVLAVATMPQLFGRRVGDALELVRQADPKWLWLAAACFVVSAVSGAQAWRSSLALLGARLDRIDAAARFSVGCLVNSFAPAKLGEAVRLALFSRRVPGGDRLWKTGGVCALVTGGRALVQTLLFAAACATGALPAWPLFVLCALVGTAGVVAWLTRGRTAGRGVAHVLDAFRVLGRSPRAAGRIVGWCALATLARVGAATAIAAAMGISRPALAGLVVVAALDLVGIVPLTPGNVGVASGAVAVALEARGVAATPALTAGIALHAVETGVSIVLGSAGTLSLVRFRSPAWRRWVVTGSTAAAALALGAALGATVLVDLV